METEKFEELNLSKELRRAVRDLGFEEMTPIQAKTIPLILEGRDVIGYRQDACFRVTHTGVDPPEDKKAPGDHPLSHT